MVNFILRFALFALQGSPLSAQEAADERALVQASLQADLGVRAEDDALAETQIDKQPDSLADDEAPQVDAQAAQTGPVSATLERLTPVLIKIEADLSSDGAVAGATFPISLAEPVENEHGIVLPAGMRGVGEIVHAKKAGGSGAGGELILTALYLDGPDSRIKLRSMKLGGTGKHQTGLAMAMAVTTFAPIGFAIRGKNITIPKGTLARAKLAETVVMQIAPSANIASGEERVPINERRNTDENE